MEPAIAKAHIPPPDFFQYTTKDVVIYALGVGAKTRVDLRYVYEMSENFLPLPTFIVVPGLRAIGAVDWPGIQFDYARLLHGEQYIEIYEELPSEAKLRSETRVVDILDKGSGALILFEDDTPRHFTSRPTVNTSHVTRDMDNDFWLQLYESLQLKPHFETQMKASKMACMVGNNGFPTVRSQNVLRIPHRIATQNMLRCYFCAYETTTPESMGCHLRSSHVVVCEGWASASSVVENILIF